MKPFLYALIWKTSIVLLACLVFVGCGSSEHQNQNLAAEAKSMDEQSPEPGALSAEPQEPHSSGFAESFSEYMHIKAYLSHDRVHPGMDLEIAFELSIKTGWHINSHSPHDAYLIPTTVELGPDSPFIMTGVTFPEPLEIKLKFSEMPVSVFEGEVLIGGVIRIPEDTVLGEYEIPTALNYQACDDTTCLPPERLEAKILIRIISRETPLIEINKEVFSRLKK